MDPSPGSNSLNRHFHPNPYLPMALISNPATDLETYPTIAEVGAFVPLLLGGHAPS